MPGGGGLLLWRVVVAFIGRPQRPPLWRRCDLRRDDL